MPNGRDGALVAAMCSIEPEYGDSERAMRLIHGVSALMFKDGDTPLAPRWNNEIFNKVSFRLLDVECEESGVSIEWRLACTLASESDPTWGNLADLSCPRG